MLAQQGDLFVMDVTKEDILRQCAIYLRKLYSHIHPLNPRLCKRFKPKEDQNTGKAKNVNIVDMVRSMGLHAKSANVQKMSIVT